MTETVAEFGFGPEPIEVIKGITGDEKYASSHLVEKRAEIVRWHEDVYAITECLGLCVFTSTGRYFMSPERMTEIFSAAMGEDFNLDQMMNLGRRIVTLEKCFNVREGATREDDTLPHRLMHEVQGDSLGEEVAINSPEKLNSDPYGAWIAKIELKDESEKGSLKDANAYAEFIKGLAGGAPPTGARAEEETA